MERRARDELSDLKDSIGQAKQKLEGDRLAESMEIARLKVTLHFFSTRCLISS